MQAKLDLNHRFSEEEFLCGIISRRVSFRRILRFESGFFIYKKLTQFL